MSLEDFHLLNDQPQETTREWCERTGTLNLIQVDRPVNPPAFDLDDTPLTHVEEIKACSILNPNCDSCQ